MNTWTITNNEKNQHFEIHAGEEIAFLEYRFYKEDIALMHTHVPEKLEGKGIASALAKHALEYAKEKGIHILVYCPFVAAYLKKHPEYNGLVTLRVIN